MERAQQQRYVWMDQARGLAVLLVILMHASAIPFMLGIEYPSVLRWLGGAASPYRMPTLLVLSGVLLVKSLRKGWWRYYSGKIQLIFWPLFVWLIIYWAVSRGDEKLDDVNYWLNGGYLWFLIVIGCCYLIAPLVRVIPAWALAVAMAVSGVVIEEPFTERFLYYGAFFFVGAQLGGHLDTFSKITSRGRFIAISIAVTWAIVVASFRISTYHRIVYFVLSTIGVLAILFAVQKIGENPITRFIGWVGRHSIVFYVAHFPIILFVCYKLIDRQVYDPWIIASVSALVSILGSIALVQVRYIVPFNWLFEMPTPSRADWQTINRALRWGPTAGDAAPVPCNSLKHADSLPRA